MISLLRSVSKEGFWHSVFIQIPARSLAMYPNSRNFCWILRYELLVTMRALWQTMTGLRLDPLVNNGMFIVITCCGVVTIPLFSLLPGLHYILVWFLGWKKLEQTSRMDATISPCWALKSCRAVCAPERWRWTLCSYSASFRNMVSMAEGQKKRLPAVLRDQPYFYESRWDGLNRYMPRMLAVRVRYQFKYFRFNVWEMCFNFWFYHKTSVNEHKLTW